MLKPIAKGIKMALSKKTVVLSDNEATKLFEEINEEEARRNMQEAIDALKESMQRNKQGALWKQLQVPVKRGVDHLF
jgi:outer membrane protein assembly factor BamD (BamD/ComL family)